MELDAACQTYIAESRDLLQTLEDLLLQAEQGAADAEGINAMFRAVHTVKGSAGLFGFDAIVAFTHLVENAMDQARDDQLALEGELIALLLECRDHIGTLVTQVAEARGQPSPEAAAVGEALLARLRAILNTPAAGPAREAIVAAEATVEKLDGTAVASEAWHISLRFGRNVFRNGMDPMSFILYLGELGEIVHLETLVDALPRAQDMDAESCYLGFEIDLKSSRDKVALEGAFDFVREDCDLRILPPRSQVSEYARLIQDLPEDAMRLGEILVKGGALTPHELTLALAEQDRSPAPGEKDHRLLGDILVEQQLAPQPVVSAALEKQKQIEERRQAETKLVKVHADKLDRVIDLVGELVIAGAGATTLAQGRGDTAMLEATARVSQLVEDIRDAALRLRMVQIGETFGRFPRIVRDVAKELGKAIELQISGADTELDKSMVERIGDPLMHLVRNAMDHGIEPAALREQRGKPAKGTVRLNAYHDSGSIVIEVGDDGGGLNRERILRKAEEKGLVAPGQALSDAEVFKLILEPGFSTAEQVSNISGRGVGMDVVKRNIEALRGSVEIASREGAGSTMRLRLPLTLAIIDGFLVDVDQASYVVPLEMVVECVELPPEARDAAAGRNYINLRGEVLPFLRLRELFEAGGPPAARENIVVVEYAGKRAGLVVDRLLGEFQTVIKPLSKLFASIKGVSGSTILGTGEVALILDVGGLLQLATSQEAQSHRSRAASAPPLITEQMA
jgi:two-component system, chemotaxis family, sensor kinase CheA